MRLASYNVENLFERPKAMNLDTWDDGADVLNDFKRLNELIQEPQYTDAIKAELLQIMKKHKGLLENGTSKFISLNESREKLLKKPKDKPVEIRAVGRGDWIGWFELEKEQIKETL